MIDDWRQKWQAGTHGLVRGDALSFGFVQLAAWVVNGPSSANIALTRWYMTAAQNTVPNSRMPNVFMASAYDLGDSKSPFGSVHPRYKQEVGMRLARAGLAVAYGKSTYTGPAPIFASGTGTSDTVQVTFEHCGAGGIVVDQYNVSTTVQQQPNWTGKHAFEICVLPPCDPASLDNSTWVGASAAVSAGAQAMAGTCSVTLKLPDDIAYRHASPTAVRFAWRAYPCEHLGCGVYSKVEQLPPPPFFLKITPS